MQEKTTHIENLMDLDLESLDSEEVDMEMAGTCLGTFACTSSVSTAGSCAGTASSSSTASSAS